MILRFFLLLLGLGGLIPSGPAVAQTGLAGTPLGVCITRVQPQDTPRTMVTQLQRFDCDPQQTKHGPGDYWVLAPPLPAGIAAPRVRVTSLAQDSLDLHVLYADGAIRSIATTSATLSRRIQLGAIVEFALPPHAAPPVRLLWHVGGSPNLRGVIAGQRIADAQDSVSANLTMAAIYAAFGGLAFALLVYNLALWGALRHRFQLVYCAMVVALIGYTLTSSGLIAWILPAIDNNDRIRISYVLLGFASASAVAFARAFFEPYVFAGWLNVAVRGATCTLALSGIAFVILSPFSFHAADRTASLMFLVGVTIAWPVLWNAWRRGSRYIGLFAVAWTVPIGFATARIFAALNLIPTTFWLDNSTVLSLGFEALVSSLAIAYRVQMLSRERDEARAGELQARELADIDPLTGLLNRRAFLHRAIGTDRRQTLHLIDIDHFKAVNETLGHDGGDEVLRVFARTLRIAVPPGALVARLGGEEFAIVLPADMPLDADALLDRLRSARMPFDLRVTASIGSCTGALATEGDWKALYRAADRALFDAKGAGRDRSRAAATRAIAA